jgi:exosortase
MSTAAMGAVLLLVFFWAYWGTLFSLVQAWMNEPDYSHGVLVLPIAIYFLYARRDRYPGISPGFGYLGMLLLLLSLGLRVAGGLYYIDSLDGWSIPLWIAGTVWVLGGWRLLAWCWPSVFFLYFMIPMPWKLENFFSQPLQAVATKVSTFMLQSLMQPALSQGNLIFLDEHRLEVAEACSGMRMFMGFFALCFAYLILIKRPAWQKVVLVISVVPIAILSNSLRVTITGLLYQAVGEEGAMQFSHDFAGYVMVILAAAFMGLVLWYMNKLVVETETVQPKRMMRRGPAT